MSPAMRGEGASNLGAFVRLHDPSSTITIMETNRIRSADLASARVKAAT